MCVLMRRLQVSTGSCARNSCVALLFLATLLLPLVSAAQTLESLFADDTAATPNPVIAQGSDGSFYGTTSEGGVSGYGTVFKVTPDGVISTLVSFNYSNGSFPESGLIEGVDGNFYGSTMYGGHGGGGTVFKVTPSGVLTTLASFDGTSGYWPTGKLVQGRDGSIYGLTLRGGNKEMGTIFKITPEGEFTEAALSDSANQAQLSAGTELVQGEDGNFYGTSSWGGANHEGAVFRITPDGLVTIVFSFNHLTSGTYPYGGLSRAEDGIFYGTTASGGANNVGTIFKITSSGTYTLLASFDQTRGASPYGTLLRAGDGDFYGATQSGGAKNLGTIFKVSPSGTITRLASLDRALSPDFNWYRWGLLQGLDGNLYGTTRSSGDGTGGRIFRVTLLGAVSTFTSFSPPRIDLRMVDSCRVWMAAFMEQRLGEVQRMPARCSKSAPLGTLLGSPRSVVRMEASRMEGWYRAVTGAFMVRRLLEGPWTTAQSLRLAPMGC